MGKMKKHHKIIIGSASFLIIGFMIISSIFMYMIFTKLDANYIELTGKIIDTQIEVENLTNNINSFDSNLSSISNNLTNMEDLKDFSKIINNSMKSIVKIEGSVKGEISQGSGFFIADDGYIVTNTHIISDLDTSSIQIETYDGKVYTFFETASIIGNSKMDVSLLKINSSDYLPLKLADSDDVFMGEKTLAIGNPFGLGFSVTQGIVSGIRKEIKGVKGYIQTDTPLNPGNSGGPLLNMDGEVVGINNYKIFLSDGLGFALESNQIKNTVNGISREKWGYDLI